jgi:hypothetical protein
VCHTAGLGGYCSVGLKGIRQGDFFSLSRRSDDILGNMQKNSSWPICHYDSINGLHKKAEEIVNGFEFSFTQLLSFFEC